MERAGFRAHRGEGLRRESSRALGVLGAIAALGTLGALALSALVVNVAARVQELPPGPGREVVAKRCIACHEADLITQQRLTRAAWARSVDKMVRWGAIVETDEREPMLEYLSAHFAAQRAASNIVATAQHEAIYKRACLTCHDADLVAAQRLSRAGWVRTVDKMIRWGAVVPDAEKEGLVDYLATRYPQR
jgi:mono/diheme cytochrome c family protein